MKHVILASFDPAQVNFLGVLDNLWYFIVTYFFGVTLC